MYNRSFVEHPEEGYGAEVLVNYREWYVKSGDFDDDQKYTILNLAPLGAWFQMKNLIWPKVALTFLGTLVTQFKDNIYPTVVAAGVNN